MPGFMDFTHVRNTGAAFGILNTAGVSVQDRGDRGHRHRGADRRRRVCRRASAHHQLVARDRAGAHHRRRGRQPDRSRSPSARWSISSTSTGRLHHFWAFNVADSAISVGVAIMILDMLGRGERMYPRLFELPGRSRVYTYGVLLAAAYLLGLKLAMVRAKARGLDADARPRPRHLHHHQRARRREAAAARSPTSERSRADPRGAAHARAVGRRVLRRPDSRGRSSRSGTSAASACRCGRRAMCSRRASRSATSSAVSAASSPAAATASRRRCRGASRSRIRSPPPTSARRSACRCTRRSCTRRAPSC